jgi:hypothetical protein
VPPYDLIGLQHVILMVGLGLGLALIIILARSSRHLSASLKPMSEKDIEESLHEFGGEVSESSHPIPWLIWLVFVGYFIWAVAYVLFISAYGL